METALGELFNVEVGFYFNKAKFAYKACMIYSLRRESLQ